MSTVSSRIITILLLIIIILPLFYKEKHPYIYVLDNKFGKSNNCYINKFDFRVCDVDNKPIVVDMYYIEEG